MIGRTHSAFGHHSVQERPHRGSTLFPYTTLFRSAWPKWWTRFAANATTQPVSLHSHRILPPRRPSAACLALKDRRSEEHTSELQSLRHLVCRLLLEKKKRSGTVIDTPSSGIIALAPVLYSSDDRPYA